MITFREARRLGKSDAVSGETTEHMQDIAESIAENYGGQHGRDLANAYLEGAGLL